MAMTLTGALRYLFTGSDTRPEAFTVKADGYEIKGNFNDAKATLMLRDFVIRECFSRGYSDATQRRLFDIYDSVCDLDDCGGTD